MKQSMKGLQSTLVRYDCEYVTGSSVGKTRKKQTPRVQELPQKEVLSSEPLRKEPKITPISVIQLESESAHQPKNMSAESNVCIVKFRRAFGESNM